MALEAHTSLLSWRCSRHSQLEVQANGPSLKGQVPVFVCSMPWAGLLGCSLRSYNCSDHKIHMTRSDNILYVSNKGKNHMYAPQSKVKPFRILC